MSVTLTDEELRTELYAHIRPLTGVTENANEWVLGTWTLSKSHTTWRTGYAHPLVVGAKFTTFTFDVDGKRGGVSVWCSSPPVNRTLPEPRARRSLRVPLRSRLEGANRGGTLECCRAVHR